MSINLKYDKILFFIPLGSYYLFTKYKDNYFYLKNNKNQENFKKLEKNNDLENIIFKNKFYNNYDSELVKQDQDNHFESLFSYLLYNNYYKKENNNFQIILPFLVGINLLSNNIALALGGTYFLTTKFNNYYIKRKLDNLEINKANKTMIINNKISNSILYICPIIFSFLLFKRYLYLFKNHSIMKINN